MAAEIRMERMTSPEIGAAIEAGNHDGRRRGGRGGAARAAPAAVRGRRARGTGSRSRSPGGSAGRSWLPRSGSAASAHHMAFPGTVSLEKETFLAVCRDYAVSLAHHGFRRVCFVPSHGGNFAPLAEARDAFNEAAGPDCSVDVYADLAEVIGVWRAVAEAEAGLGARVGGHADIAETSIMMAMHDGIVREALAECGRLTTPEEEPELIRRVLSEGVRQRDAERHPRRRARGRAPNSARR